MRRMLLLACLVACLAPGAGAAGQKSSTQPKPLTAAHAHNDYEHTRPLFDALDNGFCSVEADIYLVDGELLVAHNRDQVQKGRTLQKLYLDPLQKRVNQNGGRVYRNGPPIILMVDIKADSAQLYPVLRKQLANYRSMLTRFRSNGSIQQGAVTVILSGDRPIQQVAAETERYCGIDGRLSDLEATPPPSPALFPLISQDWEAVSTWKGEGPFPAADRRRLGEVVDKTHRLGIKLRFWGVPDTQAGWSVLKSAGLDLIGADDLPGLRAFLNGKTASAQ